MAEKDIFNELFKNNLERIQNINKNGVESVNVRQYREQAIELGNTMAMQAADTMNKLLAAYGTGYQVQQKKVGNSIELEFFDLNGKKVNGIKPISFEQSDAQGFVVRNGAPRIDQLSAHWNENGQLTLMNEYQSFIKKFADSLTLSKKVVDLKAQGKNVKARNAVASELNYIIQRAKREALQPEQSAGYRTNDANNEAMKHRSGMTSAPEAARRGSIVNYAPLIKEFMSAKYGAFNKIRNGQRKSFASIEDDMAELISQSGSEKDPLAFIRGQLRSNSRFKYLSGIDGVENAIMSVVDLGLHLGPYSENSVKNFQGGMHGQEVYGGIPQIFVNNRSIAQSRATLRKTANANRNSIVKDKSTGKTTYRNKVAGKQILFSDADLMYGDKSTGFGGGSLTGADYNLYNVATITEDLLNEWVAKYNAQTGKKLRLPAGLFKEGMLVSKQIGKSTESERLFNFKLDRDEILTRYENALDKEIAKNKIAEGDAIPQKLKENVLRSVLYGAIQKDKNFTEHGKISVNDEKALISGLLDDFAHHRDKEDAIVGGGTEKIAFGSTGANSNLKFTFGGTKSNAFGLDDDFFKFGAKEFFGGKDIAAVKLMEKELAPKEFAKILYDYSNTVFSDIFESDNQYKDKDGRQKFVKEVETKLSKYPKLKKMFKFDNKLGLVWDSEKIQTMISDSKFSPSAYVGTLIRGLNELSHDMGVDRGEDALEVTSGGVRSKNGKYFVTKGYAGYSDVYRYQNEMNVGWRERQNITRAGENFLGKAGYQSSGLKDVIEKTFFQTEEQINAYEKEKEDFSKRLERFKASANPTAFNTPLKKGDPNAVVIGFGDEYDINLSDFSDAESLFGADTSDEGDYSINTDRFANSMLGRALIAAGAIDNKGNILTDSAKKSIYFDAGTAMSLQGIDDKTGRGYHLSGTMLDLGDLTKYLPQFLDKTARDAVGKKNAFAPEDLQLISSFFRRMIEARANSLTADEFSVEAGDALGGYITNVYNSIYNKEGKKFKDFNTVSLANSGFGSVTAPDISDAVVQKAMSDIGNLSAIDKQLFGDNIFRTSASRANEFLSKMDKGSLVDIYKQVQKANNLYRYKGDIKKANEQDIRNAIIKNIDVKAFKDKYQNDKTKKIMGLAGTVTAFPDNESFGTMLADLVVDGDVSGNAIIASLGLIRRLQRDFDGDQIAYSIFENVTGATRKEYDKMRKAQSMATQAVASYEIKSARKNAEGKYLITKTDLEQYNFGDVIQTSEAQAKINKKYTGMFDNAQQRIANALYTLGLDEASGNGKNAIGSVATRELGIDIVQDAISSKKILKRMIAQEIGKEVSDSEIESLWGDLWSDSPNKKSKYYGDFMNATSQLYDMMKVEENWTNGKLLQYAQDLGIFGSDDAFLGKGRLALMAPEVDRQIRKIAEERGGVDKHYDEVIKEVFGEDKYKDYKKGMYRYDQNGDIVMGSGDEDILQKVFDKKWFQSQLQSTNSLLRSKGSNLGSVVQTKTYETGQIGITDTLSLLKRLGVEINQFQYEFVDSVNRSLESTAKELGLIGDAADRYINVMGNEMLKNSQQILKDAENFKKKNSGDKALSNLDAVWKNVKGGRTYFDRVTDIAKSYFPYEGSRTKLDVEDNPDINDDFYENLQKYQTKVNDVIDKIGKDQDFQDKVKGLTLNGIQDYLYQVVGNINSSPDQKAKAKKYLAGIGGNAIWGDKSNPSREKLRGGLAFMFGHANNAAQPITEFSSLLDTLGTDESAIALKKRISDFSRKEGDDDVISILTAIRDFGSNKFGEGTAEKNRAQRIIDDIDASAMSQKELWVMAKKLGYTGTGTLAGGVKNFATTRMRDLILQGYDRQSEEDRDKLWKEAQEYKQLIDEINRNQEGGGFLQRLNRLQARAQVTGWGRMYDTLVQENIPNSVRAEMAGKYGKVIGTEVGLPGAVNTRSGLFQFGGHADLVEYDADNKTLHISDFKNLHDVGGSLEGAQKQYALQTALYSDMARAGSEVFGSGDKERIDNFKKLWHVFNGEEMSQNIEDAFRNGIKEVYSHLNVSDRNGNQRVFNINDKNSAIAWAIKDELFYRAKDRGADFSEEERKIYGDTGSFTSVSTAAEQWYNNTQKKALGKEGIDNLEKLLKLYKELKEATIAWTDAQQKGDKTLEKYYLANLDDKSKRLGILQSNLRQGMSEEDYDDLMKAYEEGQKGIQSSEEAKHDVEVNKQQKESLSKLKADISEYKSMIAEQESMQKTLDLGQLTSAKKKEIRQYLTDRRPDIDEKYANIMSLANSFKGTEYEGKVTELLARGQRGIDSSSARNGLRFGGANNIWEWMGLDVKRTISRIFDFGIAHRALQKFTQSFQNLVNYAKQLDKVMMNLRVVTGFNATETKDLLKTYGDLATQLGSTTTEVAASADMWLRQGYAVSDTTDLIKASMALSKLGMIDAGQSTSLLTSAIKGFKLEAQDAMDVVSKFTALDQNFAISAGGIAEGLSKIANTAQLAGVSLDQAAAYVSTIVDVSQMETGAAGTALKTMMARYGNVKTGAFSDLMGDVDTEGVNDIEKVLKQIGIELRSSTYEMRDFDDVLEDVADRWLILDDVTKNALGSAFAGTRQREAFNVLMNNYDKVREAIEISENSAGTAEEKMNAYYESLEAASKRLQNTWEQFTASMETNQFIIGVTNFVNFLLDKLPTLIKILSTIALTTNSFKILPSIKGAGNFLGIGKALSFPRALFTEGGREEYFDKLSKKQTDWEQGKSKTSFGRLTDAVEKATKAIEANTDAQKPDGETGETQSDTTGGNQQPAEGGTNNTNQNGEKPQNATGGEQPAAATGGGAQNALSQNFMLSTVQQRGVVYGSSFLSRLLPFGSGKRDIEKQLRASVNARQQDYDTALKNQADILGKNPFYLDAHPGLMQGLMQSKGEVARTKQELDAAKLHLANFKSDNLTDEQKAQLEQLQAKRKQRNKNRLAGAAASGIMTGFTTAMTTEGTKGDKALMGVASGATGMVSSLLMSAGPWGMLAGVILQVVSDLLLPKLLDIIHQDEIAMKKRVEEANKNLEALRTINSSLGDIEDTVEKAVLDSDDWTKINNTIKEIRDQLFSEDNEGLYEEFLKQVQNSYGDSITSVSEALELLSSDDKETREKILQAFKTATANLNAENTNASQEVDRNKLEKENQEAINRIYNVRNKKVPTDFTGDIIEKITFGIFGGEDVLTDVLNLTDDINAALNLGDYQNIIELLQKEEKKLNDSDLKEDLLELIGVVEENIALLDKNNQKLDALNRAVNEKKVSAAITGASFNGKTISQLSEYELKTLGGDEGNINAIKMRIAEYLESAGGLQGENVFYTDGKDADGKDKKKITAGANKLIEDMMKQDEKLLKVLNGDLFTVKELALGNNHNIEQANQSKMQLARYLGISTSDFDLWLQNADELSKSTRQTLDNVQNLTLEDFNMETSEVIDKFEKISDLSLKILKGDLSSTDQLEILANFPEIFADTTEGAVNSSLQILAGYKELYEIQATNTVLNSDKWLDYFKKQLEGQDKYKDLLTNINNSGATNISQVLELIKGHTDAYNLLKELLDKDLVGIEKAHLKSLLEMQKEEFNNAISYKEKILDKELENLRAQKEAYEKINSEREYEIKLIEAKQRLEDAQRNKKMVYRAGVGMVYTEDQAAIASANKEIEQLQNQKTASSIEMQIEEIQAQKDALQNIASEIEEFNLEQKYQDFLDNYGEGINSTAAFTEKMSKEMFYINTQIQDLTGENGLLSKIKTELEQIKKQGEESPNIANNLDNIVAAQDEIANENFNKYEEAKKEYSNAIKTYEQYYKPNGILKDKGVNNLKEAENARQGLITAKENYDNAKDALSSSQKDTISQSENDEIEGANHTISYYEKHQSALSKSKLYFDVAGFMGINDWSHEKGSSFTVDLTAGNDNIYTALSNIWKDDVPKYQFNARNSNGKYGSNGKNVQIGNKQYNSDVDAKITNKSDFTDFDDFLSKIPNYTILGSAGNRTVGMVVDGKLYPMTQIKNWSGTTSFNGGPTLINEYGTEGIITPQGTFTSLPSKTGIVPADITKNVWKLGEIAPNLVAQLSSLTAKLPNGSLSNMSEDNSFNVDQLIVQMSADKNFDIDAFIVQLKQKANLTRNQRL